MNPMADPTKKRGVGISIINNTGTDIRMFHEYIMDAILAGGKLPEELADLLTLTPVDGYPDRWRVDWV